MGWDAVKLHTGKSKWKLLCSGKDFRAQWLDCLRRQRLKRVPENISCRAVLVLYWIPGQPKAAFWTMSFFRSHIATPLETWEREGWFPCPFHPAVPEQGLTWASLSWEQGQSWSWSSPQFQESRICSHTSVCILTASCERAPTVLC